MLDTTVATPSDAHNPTPASHLGCYSIRAPRWAVVYTHPQAERWANSNLTRRGYVTYLPLAAVRVRDRVTPSMLHTVQRPLFSRYLFIRFNHLADSWSPIRDTPGVLDLVRSGPDVHYAPEDAVSALQAGEAARRCLTAENTSWAPGTPCSLRKGYALEGLPAVVLSVHRDQATVAIMMLGHLRNVSVNLDCLKARDE